MDSSLFSKLQNLLDIKNKEKINIKEKILNKTGIDIQEDQIQIKGKQIKLFLSSTENSIFIQKKGAETLKEEGYFLFGSNK